VGILLGMVLLALVGSLVAPHSPTASIGVPGAGPSAGTLLGTDVLGRDVLSRLLYGGRSVFVLAASATFLAYAIGLTVGLVAGYSQTWLDGLLMRSVDVLLAFPAFLILLLAIVGLGSGPVVLVAAIAVLQAPYISRVVRTATLEVAVRGYVEAAVARGESVMSILSRDILMNIAAPVLADVGLRFTYSIILIASVNFLGLGLAPPASDWGLMVSENLQLLSINAWAVVAPALCLALLTIGVNLVGDAIARNLGRSDVTVGVG
jgi:ABC-type dipeptide/oligopeptide/nickel transport system permease subunit